jgi:DNA-binding NtrC family response regulator
VAEQAVCVAITERPLGQHRILVIEQDDRCRRDAHLTLERLGAEVTTVATAEEALAVLDSSTYTAVFQEVRPKDRGGFDTYKALKERCPSAQLAMTSAFGYDAGHAIVKARADGLKHVLFKPYKVEQLIKMLAPSPAATA